MPPELTTRDPRTRDVCHVVTLSSSTPTDRRAQAWVAESPTLSADELDAVREAAAVWRDPKYARQRLQKLCRARGWDRFALIYNVKRKFTPPPPLDLPIEPLELNESDPALRAIVERHTPVEELTETNAALRTWRRVLARGGTGFIGFISPLINGIIGLAMRNWWQFYINAGIMALGLVIFVIVWWVTSGQWFIVPGGVIRRRGVIGKLGVQLTRFRPVDAMLVVRPFPPAGWQATLVRGEHQSHLRLTTIELTALLAAWQSALPCPALEQLDDLR